MPPPNPPRHPTCITSSNAAHITNLAVAQQQGPDGRVWHNHYPMDRPLRSLRLECAAIAGLLGAPVRPLVCVHGARVDFAGLSAGEVEILPAGRLRASLTGPGQQRRSTDVAALVARAHTMLRPA
jgi:hypothetical protein